MSKGYASSYRIILLSGGLFVCFGALAVRLVWLHVVNRDELLSTIKGVRRQVIEETAKRGDITDTRGVTLATSRSMRVLGVDPHALRPKDEAKWPQLAQLIGMPEDELRRVFTTKYRLASSIDASAKPASSAGGVTFTVKPASGASSEVTANAEPAAAPDAFAAQLAAAAAAPQPAEAQNAGSDAAADELELEPNADEKGRRAIRWAKLREDISEDLYAEIMKLDVKGVYGIRGYRRAYPSNELASHIVGYVNKANVPAAGMEAYADFYLRGQNGWRVGEKDGRGRELAQYRTREVPKVDGFNVKLSLDLLVQDIIEQELAVIAENFRPVKATIIVSNPRTGFILGMANYPSFNLNEYNKVPKSEEARMKNVAVADVYEPGSVFKIVAAAAALEEKLVTPNRVFDCEMDTVIHRGVKVALPKEDHRMGDLTVSEIISHSSNKGAAQLGLLVGEAKLYDYIVNFGFRRRLGFPVGGEAPGILEHYKGWAPKDITRITMGHAIAATALQMHQAMSVIANDGVLLKPQIIQEISDANGEIVQRYGAQQLNRVVSPATARSVAQMLMGVASTEGTAKEAAIPGFDVAGKTGTTQKLIEEIRADGTKKLFYSNKHHVGSFVGFFPAGNPQVVISVIVDEAKVNTPRGVAYGRIVAAPSFKRIGERLIPILDIKSHPQTARPSLYAAHDGRP
jgi:cell division protein FtsI/penicillin-binding protein 2